MTRRPALVTVVIALLVSGLTSCDRSERQHPGDSPSASTESATRNDASAEDPTANGGDPPGSARPVTFRAADGVRLGGQLFTGGSTWVVLAHMGRPGDSMVDWLPAAGMLSRKGYTVLVFNRRGVCPGGAAGCSEGVDDYVTSWRDVVGAYTFARRNGARRIVLGGASIGAMATLRAVLRRDLDAAGIIWFGGLLNASGYRFTKREVENLTIPLLALSTREDPYGAAASAAQIARWHQHPSRPVLLPGSRHGTDVLSSRRGPALAAIEAFVERVVPASSVNQTHVRTHEYASGRLLDLYLPADPHGSLPIVVLVPGHSGDAEPRKFRGFQEWGQRLAQAGLAAAVVDYRSGAGASVEGQVDLSAAVRWIRAQTALGLDPSRVSLMGFSSGGPQLVEAAFAPDNQPISSVVCYYAAIEPRHPDSSASLAHRLSRHSLPTMVVWAANDTAPGIAAARRRFDDREPPKGVLEVVHPDAAHAFDAFEDDPTTDRIIDRTVTFLTRTLSAH